MSMYREVVYEQVVSSKEYIMAGDIGGTNSNFGFFLMRDDMPRLIFSLHAKSKHVTDFVTRM